VEKRSLSSITPSRIAMWMKRCHALDTDDASLLDQQKRYSNRIVIAKLRPSRFQMELRRATSAFDSSVISSFHSVIDAREPFLRSPYTPWSSWWVSVRMQTSIPRRRAESKGHGRRKVSGAAALGVGRPGAALACEGQHLGAEMWLARHEARLRADVASITAWRDAVRTNRLTKDKLPPPFGWMGVGPVEGDAVQPGRA